MVADSLGRIRLRQFDEISHRIVRSARHLTSRRVVSSYRRTEREGRKPIMEPGPRGDHLLQCHRHRACLGAQAAAEGAEKAGAQVRLRKVADTAASLKAGRAA
jgi:hypothetical protein